MINTLAKLMRKGGLARFSIKYFSADVEASWQFDDEQTADPALQIVYERSVTVNDERHDEKFWLYLTPEDAAAVGAVLVAWAQSHGERP